jgi:hypothetical protein
VRPIDCLGQRALSGLDTIAGLKTSASLVKEFEKHLGIELCRSELINQDFCKDVVWVALITWFQHQAQ